MLASNVAFEMLGPAKAHLPEGWIQRSFPNSVWKRQNPKTPIRHSELGASPVAETEFRPPLRYEMKFGTSRNYGIPGDEEIAKRDAIPS
jgi:hypothetical protein